MGESMIPKQLQMGQFRFVKVKPKDKGAFEKEWQTNSYMHNNPKLIEHIQTGGNYGVIGGPGGLALLDVDIMDSDFLKLIESLGETLCIKTGSGKRHYYFICLNGENIDFNNNGQHFGELRANNRYVVGPGCLHPSGNKYDILVDAPIRTIQFSEIKKILINYIKEQVEEEPIPEGEGKPLEDLDGLRKANEKLDDLLNGTWEKYKYPSRSEAEFAVVGFLKGFGFTWQQIDHVMSNVCQIGKWKEAHKGYAEITTKKASKIEISKFFEGKNFVPKYLGDEIMKNTHFRTLMGNDRMYWYNDGVYTADGKEKVKKECLKYLDKKYSVNHIRETISYIQTFTYIDPDEINNEWINLENGLLNPITKEFKMHTPEVFSIIRIPIVYDPKAQCPLFKKKLKEKLNNETIEVVQEMFGYCYLPGQKYQVGFLLYGPRRTMKSTTLFVLEKMVGNENVSAFTLQYLTNNEFASAYLYEKIANICADLPSGVLNDTGRFMTITGGDKISAARKHEHPISFYPSTKLVFSCNIIPATTNKSLAFYRRWIILPFKKRTLIDKIEPDLKEKLLEELSGILNWALEGLERLLKEDKFSYWLDEEGVRDLYEKSSDTIQSFIYNQIDCESDEGILTKREVFTAYQTYCKLNGLQPENVITFGKWFKEHTGCGTCKKGPRGESLPAYRGVNFKGDGSEKQSTLGGGDTKEE